ncbi:MAG: hypothetical protein K2I74_07845 [Treponemataceae bacterium]|nr:hypothetical protein [Treponemataceae bacterium]
MKSIKKYLFIMAALAAVFGFVACSDDEDETPYPVAVYETVSYSGYNISNPHYTVTFFSDNTWVQTTKDQQIRATGIYMGFPAASEGDIYLTPTRYSENGILIDIPAVYMETEELSIFLNKKYIFYEYLYERQ